ncbi:deoxyhypusine monooxygenase [Theileria orientalis]|uniref:Deoxyhypusine hydroxylase n=1 Tax=Theileria orientalis TaxID=68886 RepID=A0A976MA37_THEOR|nr:deoxyhypusine monooxygenase [Theileria orientalis]
MDIKSAIDEFNKLDEFARPSPSLVKSILLNKDVPLYLQLRALYFCRDLPIEDATQILISAFEVHFDTFMRHEIAYVIGQSGCVNASKRLSELVEDVSEDPMVRHEAIEALAALKSTIFIDLIKKFSKDPCRAVRDTCILALHSLESTGSASICGCTSAPPSNSAYRAIDPIPVESSDDSDIGNLESLSKVLFNQELPIYKRYEALYKIRAISGDEAAKIIGQALVMDKVSEVFRHECAFVLGQMQSTSAVESLIECLRNEDEEPMARHEAALALGSCGCIDPDNECTKKILEALEKYLNDKVKVVSDSCIVAMDYINESREGVMAN